ncbi:MAG: hypothetical protein CML17_13855 [Pusillimonas sp.]|jgi:hypothetical protein|nr:hypothetical protein [Pusillimonas sp.]|tara:strand:+ start:245 stop:643 length:399 start_codon:yes stop_codon:yes gene_type:complete
MIGFKEHIELEEDSLDEVLTKQQRIKRGRLMKRMAKRIAIKRKRKLKKRATKDELMNRAKKLARKKLAKKYLKGKDLSKLTFADRERLEKKLKGKSKVITRIAKKLLKSVKAADVARVASMRKKAGGDRKDD